MALRRGHDRGGLALGLAEEAVRGPCDQSAGRVAVLHQLQQGAGLRRRQGEILPHRGERPAALVLMRHGEHDQSGEEGLGFFVPVRLGDLSRRVHDQRLRQGGRVLAEIGAGGGQAVERVVARGGHTGDAEGVEDMDSPEASPGFARDTSVLALGVDHQHGAVRRQQVRDHGAHALAGPSRGPRSGDAPVRYSAGACRSRHRARSAGLRRTGTLRVPSGWRSERSHGCPSHCGRTRARRRSSPPRAMSPRPRPIRRSRGWRSSREPWRGS